MTVWCCPLVDSINHHRASKGKAKQVWINKWLSKGELPLLYEMHIWLLYCGRCESLKTESTKTISLSVFETAEGAV